MNTDALKCSSLLDLEHTAAAELFESVEYPWEVLPKIKEFVAAYGKSLDPAEYDEIAPQVWVHKSVKIAPTASLNGPCVIGEGTEVLVDFNISGGEEEAGNQQAQNPFMPRPRNRNNQQQKK